MDLKEQIIQDYLQQGSLPQRLPSPSVQAIKKTHGGTRFFSFSPGWEFIPLKSGAVPPLRFGAVSIR